MTCFLSGSKVWLAIVLLILCGASVTYAGIYRWVDEHGKVHYSDKRHMQAGAEDVKDQLQEAYIYEASAIYHGDYQPKDRLKAQIEIHFRFDGLRRFA